LHCLSIFHETWIEGTCSSCRCLVIFYFFKTISIFQNIPQSSVYLGYFGGLKYCFWSKNANLKLKIGIQGLLLMLHKVRKDFLKIFNCPPSTCTQSALNLCKCKEHNFIFPKMKMVEKEHLQVGKISFLFEFFWIFLLFSKNQIPKYLFLWHFPLLFECA